MHFGVLLVSRISTVFDNISKCVSRIINQSWHRKHNILVTLLIMSLSSSSAQSSASASVIILSSFTELSTSSYNANRNVFFKVDFHSKYNKNTYASLLHSHKAFTK